MQTQGLVTITPELEIGRVRIPAQACLTPSSPALEREEVWKLSETFFLGGGNHVASK